MSIIDDRGACPREKVDTSFLEAKIDKLDPTRGREWGYDVMSLSAIAPDSAALPRLIKTLVDVLSQAAHDYYSAGTSKLEDSQYDFLEKTLSVISPHHPYLKKVGYED